MAFQSCSGTEGPFASADLSAAVSMAIDLIAASRKDTKMTYLFSDFQSRTWVPDAAQDLNDRLTRLSRLSRTVLVDVLSGDRPADSN